MPSHFSPRQNRVVWSLKFPLPAPSDTVLPARFSAVPRGYGPCGFQALDCGFQALEGAVRYASAFNYNHCATTLLPNSDFLLDHVIQCGPVRAQTLLGGPGWLLCTCETCYVHSEVVKDIPYLAVATLSALSPGTASVT